MLIRNWYVLSTLIYGGNVDINRYGKRAAQVSVKKFS